MDDEQQFHTLEMPSQPSYPTTKPSPRTELHKKIEEIKVEIARLETEVETSQATVGVLLENKIKYEQRADTGSEFWGPVASTSQEIVPLQKHIAGSMEMICIYLSRLAMLEANLEEAEKEAAKRARASIGAIQTSNLSTEGPDIACIHVDGKFQLMRNWLNEEKVLLLRSPPGSGKTTFAMTFTAYLLSNGFKATYLDASLSKNTPSDTRSMDDVWRAAFESESTFPETALGCPFGEVHYVVIDEAQTWYPANMNNSKGQKEVFGFWADVKFHVKPALKLEDYANYLHSMELSSSQATGLRLLCLAGYGEANVGSITTPIVFVDPEDSATGLRLPLGLNFLRLDYQFAEKLIIKFSEVKASLGKPTNFDAETCDLIFNETNGHVGAIRTLLHHLDSSNRRSKQDIFDFIGHVVYQRDLSAFPAFHSVSQTTIGRLPSRDLALLVQCIVLYKKGKRDFLVLESHVAEMVKLGIFVKISDTAIGRARVAFPSPLHFDLALYNILHRNLVLQQNYDSFETFIRELVLRMSPKALLEMSQMTPDGLVPLERHWQDELSQSFWKISTALMGLDVGREYGRAFLDVYINNLQWGIELLREGDRSRLDEHVGRFQPGGLYHSIPMARYAVLNFTGSVPDSAVIELYDANVYHLVYNEGYTKVIVHRRGKRTEDWDMIGHQGRAEH